MKYVFITGFILMVAAQWYVPLSMVYDAEKTNQEGVTYRFKTRPIDPSDPFRGKYITLHFDAQTYYPADTNELHFQRNQTVYALVSTDSTGFARIAKLLPEAPDGDTDYISATFRYGYRNYQGDAAIDLDLPFQRFYVEESKAPEAERLYWTSRDDSTKLCYADIKIRQGNAMLVDVMINDTSVVDIVKRMNATGD
jgi:uncharacterized membrane-anchored protein